MEHVPCVLLCSHYIVPELGPHIRFSYASHKAVDEFKEAKAVSIPQLQYRLAFCSKFFCLNC